MWLHHKLALVGLAVVLLASQSAAAANSSMKSCKTAFASCSQMCRAKYGSDPIRLDKCLQGRCQSDYRGCVGSRNNTAPPSGGAAPN